MPDLILLSAIFPLLVVPPARGEGPPLQSWNGKASEISTPTARGSASSRPVHLQNLKEAFDKSFSEEVSKNKPGDSGKTLQKADNFGSSKDRDSFFREKIGAKTGVSTGQERPNLFNPAISLLGIFIGGWTKKPVEETAVASELDPKETGFFLQKAELTFSSDIDPYFTALAILGFRIAEEGLEFELEEIYLQTLSLPWGLKVRMGKYLSEVSRLGSKHLHFLNFVEKPLPIVMAYGGESSWFGVEISWLLPLPFYLELVIDAGSGESGAFPLADPSRPDVGGHLKGYIELGGEVSFLFGFGARNGLWVRAGGAELSKTILDGYLHLRWKSPASYSYLMWMAEFVAVYSECGPGVEPSALCGEKSHQKARFYWNIGGITQLIWRFGKRWRTGAKFEALYLEGAGSWGPSSRLAAMLEFSPSEFSRLKLQFSASDLFGLGEAKKTAEPNFAVWLQLQFSMGVHGAHPY